jgi:hypothetical protein
MGAKIFSSSANRCASTKASLEGQAKIHTSTFIKFKPDDESFL